MIVDKNFLLEKNAYYLSIPSPAGYTYEAMNAVEADFKKLGYETKRTNKRALMVEIEGQMTEEKVMVTAHIDTLGGMVKSITSEGKLKYHKLGGGSYHATEGENITLFASNGQTFRGAIIPKMASTHIYGDAARNTVRDENNTLLRLDERVFNAQDVLNLGISVGDIFAFDTRYETTESGFIKSRYLDDKICVAMLLEVARYLKEKGEKPAYTTVFYISNYEEVGHGVSVLSPDITEILALDIGTVGGEQMSSEYKVSIAAKDNHGPYDYDMRKRLTDLCLSHDIPYAVDVYNRYSSDGSAAVHHGFDVRHACIGPGVDATHHYERTHFESVEATTRLIYHYLMKH